MERRPARPEARSSRLEQEPKPRRAAVVRRSRSDLLMAPVWGLADLADLLFGRLWRLLPRGLRALLVGIVLLPYRLVVAAGGVGWFWALTLGALLVEKAVWVSNSPGYPSVWRGMSSVGHDGLLVAIACFFLALPARSLWLRPLLRLPALLVVLAMAADLGVRKTFAFRLNWDDVLPYFDLQVAREIGAAEPVLSGLFALMTVVLLTLALGLRLSRTAAGSAIWFGSAALIGLIAFALSPNARSDVHSWEWRNVLGYNLFRGVDRALSPPGEDELVLLPSCEPLEERGLLEHDKVILVLVESLSSWQSDYFSGIGDWTPNLDEIARNGWVFTNFYANGFNTAGGLVATLAGDLPLQPPASVALAGRRQAALFQFASSDRRDLLGLMRQRGWQSYFLTSGRAEFSGKKSWLQRIGFQTVDDAEADFYDGLRQYVFDGAADEHLYRRALEVITQAREPWFMALETISTHPPYEDPASGEYSLEKAMRYADAELGKFVDALEREGFFAFGGLLIVTGDHRSMHRLTEGELFLRGQRAQGWMPLVVYGGEAGRWAGDPKRTVAAFQQVDLYNGLRTLVSGTSCTIDWRGDVFSETPAECSFYVPGGDRSRVLAYCGQESFVVELDGDDTAALYGATPPDWIIPRLAGWRRRQPAAEDSP